MNLITVPPLRVEAHAFGSADLCSGHVVLDFVNTAAGLNRDPRDWLDSFARLVCWAALAGVCDSDRQSELLAMDRANPNAGVGALDHARSLRSAIYELVHASRAGTIPSRSSVATLQSWCRRGGRAVDLNWQNGRLQSSQESAGIDVITTTIAAAAVEFLQDYCGNQIGVCDGRNCGWLFLDTSKSRRRRWCNMKTCGNAAKASRSYYRHRPAKRLIVPKSPT